MHPYILEAHQGVATECPGNTMAAFRAAARQGYGMIELDTKFTADDRCVILHDTTVNRTGRRKDGSAFPDPVPIGSLTLAQSKALDFGLAFSPEFRGEEIPTLEEVLEFAKAAAIPLKFDNVLQSHTLRQQEIFFRTVRQLGAEAWVGFTGNSLAYLTMVHKEFPDAMLHYDGPVTEESLQALSALAPKEQLAVWMHPENEATAWCRVPPVTERDAERVHRTAQLGLWLLRTEAERQEALGRFGADLIETDGSLKPEHRQ